MVVFKGFETGDLTEFTGTVIDAGQTLAASTDYAHTGTYGCKCTTASGKMAYAYQTFTTASTNYLEFQVYISSDSGTAFIPLGGFWQIARSSSALAQVGYIGSTRTINLHWTTDDWVSHDAASATTIATGAWHRIKLYTKKSATVGELHVYLDEVELSDIAQTNQNFNWGLMQFGVGTVVVNWRGTVTFYVDCVYYDTSDIGLEAVTYTSTFTVNSNLLANFTKTFTGNANLLQNLIKTLTINANLTKNLTIPFTLNANLQGPELLGFTVNTNLQKSLTTPFTIGASLIQEEAAGFTIGANLQATLTKSFTIDAELFQTETKGFSVNANLLQTQIIPFTMNAELITGILPSTTVGVGGYFRDVPQRRVLSPELLRLIRQYLEIKIGEENE